MHPDTATSSSSGREVFFWNVNNPVGHNGVNQMDDVLFVSWCIYKAAKFPDLPADLREVFKNAGLTHMCDGTKDHRLVTAIYALQRAFGRGGLVDGRISPAKGVTYAHHRAKHLYMIFELNSYLRVMHPEQYPRIDLMPEFPWKLKQFALAPFIA